MTTIDKKYAVFVGRWQPFHRGHEWLINQKLEEGTPVLLLIRNPKEQDENNPLTAMDVLEVLYSRYIDNENVISMILPVDVESINYGRGVGYDVTEHEPPTDIHGISATEIRKQIKRGDDSWKQHVDSSIHSLLEKFLTD